MTGWQELANAIVEQAARDYVAVLKKLLRSPKNDKLRREKKSLERFFQSGLYGMLTHVDSDYLLKQLRRKVSV